MVLKPGVDAAFPWRGKAASGRPGASILRPVAFLKVACVAEFGFFGGVEIFFARYELRLRRPWRIARTAQGPEAEALRRETIFVRLRDEDGVEGWGEGSPSLRYGESAETAAAALRRVDPAWLSFERPGAARARLRSELTRDRAARCALSLALTDGAARRRGLGLARFLGLEPPRTPRLSSVTVGIDRPERVREKARELRAYPRLKLKLGVSEDRELFRAFREGAPDNVTRVDANEGWPSVEEALRRLEWLAADGRVEFVEQPLPASLPLEEHLRLKERSPLPLFADESCLDAADAERCAAAFHGVNVKVVKTGGVAEAKETLEAARARGLQTMLGGMVESSLSVTATAHLAALADYLDLDGAWLTANDPFRGVWIDEGGVVRFDAAEGRAGIGVEPRREARLEWRRI